MGQRQSRGKRPPLHPPPPPSTLDLLASLVNKSLLRVRDDDGDEQRFGMLETIREYGLERLAASGEEREVRRRHQTWCLDLAQRAELGTSLPPNDREFNERYIGEASAQIGADAFAAAWAEGEAMPLDEAIDYALD